MSSGEAHGSTRVVIAALAGNVAIAASKFVAAYFSHSTAMLAEAVHSLSDTGNQILLLVGMRLALAPPSDKYPFGRAGEQYFWPFIVSLLLFGMGGTVAIYEGISKILHPGIEPTTRQLLWAYVVLGTSVLFEAFSFSVAAKEFRSLAGGRTIRQVITEGRDVTVLLVMIEDAAALVGLAVALIGVFVSNITGATWMDGAASLVIGVILCVVASLLASQTHGLLIGKSATREDRDRARKIIEGSPHVEKLVEMLTLHLGPNDILLAIKVGFTPTLTLALLEESINEMERRLRSEMPKLKRIFVEPDSEGDPEPSVGAITPPPPPSDGTPNRTAGAGSA